MLLDSCSANTTPHGSQGGVYGQKWLPVLGQFRHVVATYIMPNLLVRVKTGSENNRGDLMVHISKPKS